MAFSENNEYFTNNSSGILILNFKTIFFFSEISEKGKPSKTVFFTIKVGLQLGWTTHDLNQYFPMKG